MTSSNAAPQDKCSHCARACAQRMPLIEALVSLRIIKWSFKSVVIPCLYSSVTQSAVFAGSPSPVDQAVTDLGTLKSQLPSITAMTNVKSLLNTPKSTLESSTSAPFTVNGPIYKNWISLLK